MPKERFQLERLRRIQSLEREHFWFLGRRSLIQAYLRQALEGSEGVILDIGSGTGYFLEELAKSLPKGRFLSIGLDARPEGLQERRGKCPEMSFVQGDAERLPFGTACVSLVTAFDVLEHLDDRKAIQEIHRILRPQGRLLLTVPIGPWLFGYRDQDAGHRRRYKRRELFSCLRDSGFKVRVWSYYQFALLPALAISRTLGGRRLRDAEENIPRSLNRLLAWVNLSEARLSRYLRWPYGSSLIALCEKN